MQPDWFHTGDIERGKAAKQSDLFLTAEEVAISYAKAVLTDSSASSEGRRAHPGW